MGFVAHETVQAICGLRCSIGVELPARHNVNTVTVTDHHTGLYQTKPCHRERAMHRLDPDMTSGTHNEVTSHKMPKQPRVTTP